MTRMIRPAAHEDCPALAALYARGFENAWTAEDFQTLIMDGADTLIIEQEGTVISLLLSRIMIDEAEIITFVTDPEHYRKGHARRLLEALMEDYRRRGVVKLFLEVREDNEAARALYQNSGFETIGRRPNYYTLADGSQKDAVTLLKFL